MKNNARSHQILLVNFTQREADEVTKAGFNAEVGHTYRTGQRLWFSSPHPIHEYDVYVYNSELTEAPLTEHAISIADNPQFLSEINSMQTLPFIRIAFLGDVRKSEQPLIGTSHINAIKAHANVSIVIPTSNVSQKIKPLHDLLEKSVGQIKIPVAQYITTIPGELDYPYSLVPAFVNRNSDIIGAYGVSYERKDLPHYVTLPQYQKNTLILINILEVFADIRPKLFPGFASSGWEDAAEFRAPREIQIHEEIIAKQEEARAFVTARSAELALAGQEFAFIKAILTALETAEIPSEERLSLRVKQVLTYLGFQVRDIDQEIKTAIRKEDLWVQDGSFLAITEINGTQKKNPKRTEYNDLLGRMNTIFKRRDLVPEAENITGLLILNYDSKTHPDKRPALYSGDDSDIARAAAETDIGILSTVELYKLARAVLYGTITKCEAREQIKTFGLIKANVPARITSPDARP